MGEWRKNYKVFWSFIPSFQRSIVKDRRSRLEVKSDWRFKVNCGWYKYDDANSFDGHHCCWYCYYWSCNSSSCDNMDTKKVRLNKWGHLRSNWLKSHENYFDYRTREEGIKCLILTKNIKLLHYTECNPECSSPQHTRECETTLHDTKCTTEGTSLWRPCMVIIVHNFLIAKIFENLTKAFAWLIFPVQNLDWNFEVFGLCVCYNSVFLYFHSKRTSWL